jgi:tRNA splicing ligase
MSSTVRIPWSRNYEIERNWNEVCVRVIEMFGLPGDRYVTHSNIMYMDFVFKSNKDALMFAIEHNGVIVPDEQLTTEVFSRYL